MNHNHYSKVHSFFVLDLSLSFVFVSDIWAVKSASKYPYCILHIKVCASPLIDVISHVYPIARGSCINVWVCTYMYGKGV